MFVDVFAFDECRYVYDWLPTLDLVSDVFRFALDGLSSQYRWYADDYISGAHCVDCMTEIKAAELAARIDIKSSDGPKAASIEVG
jgi:hypothetical protein